MGDRAGTFVVVVVFGTAAFVALIWAVSLASSMAADILTGVVLGGGVVDMLHQRRNRRNSIYRRDVPEE